VAGELRLVEINALLAAANLSVLVRVVEEISQPRETYVLASIFDNDRGNGLIGIFAPVSYRLKHFRFTRHRETCTQLEQVKSGEQLWWTRRGLPSLRSPYYPFVREDGPTGPRYKRLIDGEYMQ